MTTAAPTALLRKVVLISADQRRKYFRYAWPQACAAQGWQPKDEEQRRRVTHMLTGRHSITELDQAGITVLFRGLELLADPDSVAKSAALVEAQDCASMPTDDARTHEAKSERAEHRDVVALIRQEGFADAYVAKVAIAHCRREGIAEWTDLPSTALWKTLYTVRTRRTKQRREEREREMREHPKRPLRPIKERKDPWHQRDEAQQHVAFVDALRAADGVRLEEITPSREMELLESIAADGHRICECATCRRRRKGDPGNAAAEQRQATPF